MKILTVKLEDRDLEDENISFVLSKIAEMLSEGFLSGIECPVHWNITTDNRESPILLLKQSIGTAHGLIEDMPDKGNKRGLPQKKVLLKSIKQLHQAIDDTVPEDFKA